MATNFRQGYFKPNHPEKYIGDVNKIVFRSSWELRFNQFMDNNPNVLKWASEPFAIQYIKPTDNKIHNYFPDYYVMFQKSNGSVEEELIEVKPKKQTKPSRSRNTQNQLYENLQYAVNIAKWKQAEQWCEQRSKQTGRTIKFRIVTEAELFL